MTITRIDLKNSAHSRALTDLLDQYAMDPTGGASALPEDVLKRLPAVLADCPTWLGLLAWQDDEPAGVLNAFWSVSTFKAQKLLNIHDIAVAARFRRHGIGRSLLREIESIGTDMGCCKITLEVLEGNSPATALYRLMGFENYQLDPQMGDARLMQKWLTTKQ